MENFSGGELLNKKYPDLPKSEQVNSSVEDFNGARNSIKIIPEMTKDEKTEHWIEATENFHKRHRDDPEATKHIKDAFHNKYVIKSEDIPESYFENQQRITRNLGRGDIEVTEEVRKEAISTIISDQESTLDRWTDYLFHKDTDDYPMWVKYWVLRSMTKLSGYDKEKKSYGNRRKDTVAPFPDLNQEALAHVIDNITKKANKEDNSNLQKFIQNENFGKLYAYEMERINSIEGVEGDELLITKGEWIKYPKDSDCASLVESIQNHGTGWCIAAETTAKRYLKRGDIYIFYSDDKDGNPSTPRVAISMREDSIGEIRGIAPDQNLDNQIQGVLDEKLSEFPDADNFQKKTADMKFLTEIEKKVNKKEELNTEDLKFLYELDSRIEGFGYKEDPRVEEIKQGRDIKTDLSLATGFPKEQISTTKEEALSGGIKFHYGDLDFFSLKSAKGLKFPEIVNCGLELGGLQSVEGLKLPETINDYLSLRSLQSAVGLKLPEIMNDGLNLNGLQSAEGLKFPETINGDLYLRSLQSVEGLELSETIGGDIYLDSLPLLEKEELRKKYPELSII